MTDSNFGTIHVAENERGVCGFAAAGAARQSIPGYSAELYAIYLLAREQHAGLGALLFRHVLQALTARALDGIYVWVLQQNRSRGFYERMGGVLLTLEEEVQIGGAALTQVAYGWRGYGAIAGHQATHR